MAKLKIKEIEKMTKEERAKQMEELKFELVKSKAAASKSGSAKIKEIKRAIARIITLNNQHKNAEVVKNK